MTIAGATPARLLGAFVAGRLVPRSWPGRTLVAATLAGAWWLVKHRS